MFLFFFFKQKTAYEMRISDWSSDVCSSDLPNRAGHRAAPVAALREIVVVADRAHQRVPRGRDMLDAPFGDRRLSRKAVAGKRRDHEVEIGRASCRERVCQYV